MYCKLIYFINNKDKLDYKSLNYHFPISNKKKIKFVLHRKSIYNKKDLRNSNE